MTHPPYHLRLSSSRLRSCTCSAAKHKPQDAHPQQLAPEPAAALMASTKPSTQSQTPRNLTRSDQSSLASQLVVKGGQADAERLQWGQWPREVACEAALRHLAKLQHHSFRVTCCHQLEVLDTGLCHAAIEVEAVGVEGIVPLGLLVLQHHQVVGRSPTSPAGQHKHACQPDCKHLLLLVSSTHNG